MSSSRGKGRRKFTVDSLFQDTTPRAAGVRDLIDAKEIDIERITPDPEQPRQTFDPDALNELAQSIRQEGVLQPIAVRYEDAEDRYIIVHGERRWRAAQIAGLTAVPAIVRDVPEDRRLIHQLMENVVREDLNAVDRAAALRSLKRQMDDAPWERVAEAVGIRRSRLFQLLSTEKLAESVQQRIRSGELSEKQTRVLQGLSPDAQEILAGMLVSGLSEQDVRNIGRKLRDDPSYLELDQSDLTARIQEYRGSEQSVGDVPRRQRDPLVDALAALGGDDELADDPDEALSRFSQRLHDGHSPRSDLTSDLHRLGYQLGLVAARRTEDTIPPKQLRALKRLIDLALQSQRRR